MVPTPAKRRSQLQQAAANRQQDDNHELGSGSTAPLADHVDCTVGKTNNNPSDILSGDNQHAIRSSRAAACDQVDDPYCAQRLVHLLPSSRRQVSQLSEEAEIYLEEDEVDNDELFMEEEEEEEEGIYELWPIVEEDEELMMQSEAPLELRHPQARIPAASQITSSRSDDVFTCRLNGDSAKPQTTSGKDKQPAAESCDPSANQQREKISKLANGSDKSAQQTDNSDELLLQSADKQQTEDEQNDSIRPQAESASDSFRDTVQTTKSDESNPAARSLHLPEESGEKLDAEPNSRCPPSSKCDNSSTATTNGKTIMHQQQQQRQLPSTNRLISEHQARQQQALFRCLAERQKMMDEMGRSGGVDLMSVAALRATSGQQRRHRRLRRSTSGDRRERRRSCSSDAASGKRRAAGQSGGSERGGVPLSAVDLSSMSDRMLDDLLGHIASASSSSLSSNGESLDSSDLSTTSTEDDSSEEDHCAGSRHRNYDFRGQSEYLSTGDEESSASQGAARLNGAPNVIGVHEDERTRHPAGAVADTEPSASRRQLNCRAAHRQARSGGRSPDPDDEQDEDDDRQNEHELMLRVGPQNGLSLSPPASMTHGRGQQPAATEEPTSAGGGSSSQAAARSRLEQYFTSELVNAHQDSPEVATAPTPEQPAAAHSVEEVLSRMLEALNEIGTENQEQLNELLERGFAHLEQLLNFSLGPQTGSNSQENNHLNTRSQQQPNMAQKLISTQTAAAAGSGTMLSKDSDYGSDTQSADCFTSNCTSGSELLSKQQQPKQEPSASPSPTSMATTASGSSGCAGMTEQLPVSGGGSALSPLAIELSYRLAESLQRLQLAARRAREPPRPASGASASDSCPSPAAPDTPTQQTQGSRGSIKSPMKSVVMLNVANASANIRPASANSVVSSSTSSQSTSFNHQNETNMNEKRNMTPTSMQSFAGSESRPTSGSSPVFISSSTSQSTAKTQPFKTRVNINGGGSTSHSASSVSNCVIVTSPMASVAQQATTGSSDFSISQRGQIDDCADLRRPRAANTKTQDSDEEEGSSETKLEEAKLEQDPSLKLTSSEEQEEGASCKQAEQVQPGALTSGGQQMPVERRRSALRSSLRRRPSFSGSAISGSGSGLREPRPGSPVPRSILQPPQATGELQQKHEPQLQPTGEQLKVNGEKLPPGKTKINNKQIAASGSTERAQEELELKQKQRQLQRALILAQKYNYSPAKLAASKLSSKLQLPASNKQQNYDSATGNGINGNETLDGFGHQQQKELPNGYKPAGDLEKVGGSSRRRPINVSGQVQLDISYFAKSGSLTVHVIQCCQLAPVSKRRTTSNPYVKLYLLPDRSKSGKRKSSIQRNELSPKFDERFTFGPLLLADFDQRIIWLSVWHRDRLGRNEFLGETLIPLSRIRRQLLSSDLCQATAAKWYQLHDRADTSTSLAAAVAASQQQQLHLSGDNNGRRRSDDQGAISDRNRKLGGGEGHGGRRQSEPRAPSHEGGDTLDRLGELQRKADRLTTAVAPPVAAGAHHPQHPQLMSVRLASPAPAAGSQPQITGQLFVALKFVPRTGSGSEGELQVMIKEAHNIGGFDAASLSLQAAIAQQDGGSSGQQPLRPPTGSLPNPLCKCYLLSSSGQRLAKQKTPHLKRTVNPRWDHKCVFGSLRLNQLTGQAIELHMFNRDSILVSSHRNEYLGGVRLCRGRTISHHQSAAGSEADATSIASSEQSAGEGQQPQPTAQRLFSRQNSGKSSVSGGTGSQQQPQLISSGTLRRAASQADEMDEGALCSERESRLWCQMLARPNIWVYGELKLRHLRPLVAASRHQLPVGNIPVAGPYDTQQQLA